MQIAIAAVIIIAAAVGAGWILMRRRRRAWRELARRRGLAFRRTREGPRVTGVLDGRRVEVRTVDRGSDTMAGGVEVVAVSAGLKGRIPRMTAQGVPGLIGDLARLAQDRLETGSEPFDRDVLLQAEDPGAALAYWNKVRRQTFLRLIENAPGGQVEIRDGALTAEWRSIGSGRDRLERLLDLLLDAAKRLDGEAGKGG